MCPGLAPVPPEVSIPLDGAGTMAAGVRSLLFQAVSHEPLAALARLQVHLEPEPVTASPTTSSEWRPARE